MRRLTLGLAISAALIAGCDHESNGSATPSAVDREAEAASANAAAVDVQQCFADRGFVVREDAEGQGGFSVEEPTNEAGQQDFDRAWRECNSLFTRPVPLSETEIEDHYDALIEVAQCLREQGYAPTEPPSKEVFVTAYQAAQAGQPVEDLWHPYFGLPDAEYETFESACPQP